VARISETGRVARMLKQRWPAVLSEDETLRLVLEGRSLARYGDGEFKICFGGNAKSQKFDPLLAKRLREILKSTPSSCLVGIPNLHEPTKPFWDQFRNDRTVGLFDMKRRYASAFVSRPDSAPWIHRPDYWAQLEKLWKGQAVTLVRGSNKSLTFDLLTRSAASVNEILCARQHAWADRDELLERIGRPSRVLLCCGATATVLAADLDARGVHAVDLGHIGMWVKRLDMSAEAALQAGRAEPL
jgi:hypothetical protein